MKAYIERRAGEWTAVIQQGVQYFTLEYRGTKKEAEWVVKMFKIALRAHNKQIRKK